MRFLLHLTLAALALMLAASPARAASVAFATQAAGHPAATQMIPFLVHLPLHNVAELEALVTLQGTPGTQAYHHWLTPAQFSVRYAATPAERAIAVRALRAAGMSVDGFSAQFITAHATTAVLERTFDARMALFRGPSGRVHVASSVTLHLPPALLALNADVEGVVYHGEAEPMLRIAPAGLRGPLNRYGLFGPLWADDIRQAYAYPAYGLANGRGVRVATVNEADFDSGDLVTYLAHERIGAGQNALAPLPTVTHALVPGAPRFSTSSNASSEADLDTQQVAGTAPGATLTGWTTNAYDFPADFLQVYDTINETNSQDIVSTSYGKCELLFTAPYNGGVDNTGIVQALHATFLQGNAQGITYLVSSGDSAGRPCPEAAYLTHPQAGKTYATVPSVSMPASDPNVVAVGGGNLITSSDPDNPQDFNAAYLSENAYADAEPASDPYLFGNTLTQQWWGAGGGQSAVFAKPAWQKGITPGTTRSVPDIGLFVGGCFALNAAFVQPCADDVSHATLIFGGALYNVIGTSVSAPEAAGLFATIEDYEGSRKLPGSGRLGNVNPLLYRSPATYFHQNIPGYNGVVSFSGTQRWNPSYGLGSLFNISPFRVSSGIPQTATNP